jgi:hypothetical protein
MYSQINGLIRHSFAGPCYFVSLGLNLLPNQVEVSELLSFFVFELTEVLGILFCPDGINVAQ